MQSNSINKRKGANKCLKKISRKRSASHIFLKWLLHLKVVMITYIIYLLVCRIITGNELHLFCQVSKQRNKWMCKFLNVGFADLWVQRWTLLFQFPSTHQSTLLRPSINIFHGNIPFFSVFGMAAGFNWKHPTQWECFPHFCFPTEFLLFELQISKACSFDFRYLLRRSYMEEWHRK